MPWDRRPVGFLLAALLVCTAAPPLRGQEPFKIPEPEAIVLPTADGVELHATFFPGTMGEKSIPVIMLHSSKGDRREFEELARFLQAPPANAPGATPETPVGLGCAVIVPDLRGFGESTRAGGGAVTLSPSSMRPADYAMMYKADVETVKSELIKLNNARKLNIEKLCVVGTEMGAVVALNWAAVDWSWPVLSRGKQGQDVKALVLISPGWGFKGVRIVEALAHPNVRADLSVLIVVGKGNSKAFAEAKRLKGAFDKYHPEPPQEEMLQKKDLYFDTPNTSLQGAKLLAEKSFEVQQHIATFIELRVGKKPFPWAERVNPLE